MRIPASLSAVALPLLSITQVPVLQWGHTLSGPGNLTNYINNCRGVTTDPDGSVYTVGEFANNLDLDPGPGTALVTSSGQTDFDMFLAKYDQQGQFQWGKQIVTGSLCYGSWLHRQPSGDLVMAGYLAGTTDFDPGPGELSITGTADLFFARYAPDGEVMWAKTFGSVSGVDELHAMEVDAAGNIWIAGSFNDTIDLDPGPGVAQFLCTPASRDGFFVKYDADGNYLWGHTFGNTWSDEAKAIAITPAGNAVITGYFSTSVDLEPGSGNTTAFQLGTSGDAFVATYSGDGALLDHFVFGGSASEMEPEALTADTSGNITVLGRLYGSGASFLPGQASGTVNAGSNAWGWMARYGADGTLLWTDLLVTNGSSGTGAKRMALSAEGDVLVAGEHTTPFDADPGAGSLQLGAGGYLLKYAGADGALQWAATTGSGTSQYVNEIAVFQNGDICIAAGGNSSWSFNGEELGGGNVAVLMRTGECEPAQAIGMLEMPTTLCAGSQTTAELMATGTNLHYTWLLNGDTIGGDAPLCTFTVPDTGPLDLLCVLNNACGADTSGTITFSVEATPDPVIIEVAGTLICNEPADLYSWNLDGQPILGANGSSYTPSVSGFYTVTAINGLACGATSSPFFFTVNSVQQVAATYTMMRFDPQRSMLAVRNGQVGSPVLILEASGRVVFTRTLRGTDNQFDLTALRSGMYFARSGSEVLRFVR